VDLHIGWIECDARWSGTVSGAHGLEGAAKVKRYQTRYFRRHNDRELLLSGLWSLLGVAMAVLVAYCLIGGAQ
jgi:hypothetical protein